MTVGNLGTEGNGDNMEVQRLSMGNRTESRAQRSLEVRVLGMDASGHPILATARTVNISRHGVVLEGLASQVSPGEVLSLQYKGRKVRYRVIWSGEARTEQDGQLGLEKVTLRDDLWQQDMPPLEGAGDMRARRELPEIDFRNFAQDLRRLGSFHG